MRRRKGQERDASVYQEETRDGHTALLGPHTSFHCQHLILILNTFTLQSGVYAHAWRNPWRHGEPRRHTSTRWRSHVHPVTLTRPPRDAHLCTLPGTRTRSRWRGPCRWQRSGTGRRDTRRTPLRSRGHGSLRDSRKGLRSNHNHLNAHRTSLPGRQWVFKGKWGANRWDWRSWVSRDTLKCKFPGRLWRICPYHLLPWAQPLSWSTRWPHYDVTSTGTGGRET